MGSLIRPLVSPEPPPLSAACLSLQPSTPHIRAPAHPRSHVIEQVPAQVHTYMIHTYVGTYVPAQVPATCAHGPLCGRLCIALHSAPSPALLLLLLLLPLLPLSACLVTPQLPLPLPLLFFQQPDKKSLPLFPCRPPFCRLVLIIQLITTVTVASSLAACSAQYRAPQPPSPVIRKYQSTVSSHHARLARSHPPSPVLSDAAPILPSAFLRHNKSRRSE